MIQIKKVESKSDFKSFVKFPFKLYKGNPFWVSPIINEELNLIDVKKNPVFQNAEAEFFLAYINNEVVGRIAAIINWIEVNQLKKRKMRFGWFDCIDDKKVSQSLLNKVERLGKEKKMEFVEGPVGFSNLDKAGLLVYGFEEMNTMITQYNFPYYSDHLKALGYKKLAQWV